MKYLLSYQSIILAIVLLMGWGCVIEDVEGELQREVPTIEDDTTNNEEDLDLEGVVICCDLTPRYFKFPSVVDYYINPSALAIHKSADSIAAIQWGLIDENFHNNLKYIKDSIELEHRYYAVKYGDTSSIKNHNSYMFVLQDTILSLDVFSDNDYDDDLLAGHSLVEILDVSYVSWRLYIENSYRLEGSDTMLITDVARIRKPLNEFNNNMNNYLIENAAHRLIFTKRPAKTSTHTFTIHYKERSGKHLQYTMDPITIQGRED
jgi:hypothetical protein